MKIILETTRKQYISLSSIAHTGRTKNVVCNREALASLLIDHTVMANRLERQGAHITTATDNDPDGS